MRMRSDTQAKDVTNDQTGRTMTCTFRSKPRSCRQETVATSRTLALMRVNSDTR